MSFDKFLLPIIDLSDTLLFMEIGAHSGSGSIDLHHPISLREVAQRVNYAISIQEAVGDAGFTHIGKVQWKVPDRDGSDSIVIINIPGLVVDDKRSDTIDIEGHFALIHAKIGSSKFTIALMAAFKSRDEEVTGKVVASVVDQQHGKPLMTEIIDDDNDLLTQVEMTKSLLWWRLTGKEHKASPYMTVGGVERETCECNLDGIYLKPCAECFHVLMLNERQRLNQKGTDMGYSVTTEVPAIKSKHVKLAMPKDTLTSKETTVSRQALKVLPEIADLAVMDSGACPSGYIDGRSMTAKQLSGLTYENTLRLVITQNQKPHMGTVVLNATKGYGRQLVVGSKKSPGKPTLLMKGTASVVVEDAEGVIHAITSKAGKVKVGAIGSPGVQVQSMEAALESLGVSDCPHPTTLPTENQTKEDEGASQGKP